MTLSRKLILLGICLLVLFTSLLFRRFDLQTSCRTLLLVLLIVGVGVWLKRKGASEGRTLAQARLTVLGRAVVSNKCSLALVEAQGVQYLIAHGDGFVQLQQVSSSPAGQAVLQ